MMQQEQFAAQLRHLLANIHDHAVLEKHPLNDLFPKPESSSSRAGHLRRRVATAIEILKPQNLPFDVSATEWRYYLILHGRYVEGANLSDLQNRLALGDRQERRLHMRALTLLAAILYEHVIGSLVSRQLSPATLIDGQALAAQDDESADSIDRSDREQGETAFFHMSPELLHIRRVLDEVLDLCAPRIYACGAKLVTQVPDNLPPVRIDRIILRQILLYLVNTVLLTWQQATQKEPIIVAAHRLAEAIALEFIWQADAEHPTLTQFAQQTPLRYWLENLHMQLILSQDADHPHNRQGSLLRITFLLPVANQATLLVVDDHESATRIIQRYLQATTIHVVGETDPTRVPELVHMLRPQVLLLDVMMPTTDGWELLQRIKADPETQAIPVVICSVWNVPELALSLGANDFLKKPISREDLLESLARLLPPAALVHADQGFHPETWLGTWAESRPVDS